jgi:hypothetical protein
VSALPLVLGYSVNLHASLYPQEHSAISSRASENPHGIVRRSLYNTF